MHLDQRHDETGGQVVVGNVRDEVKLGGIDRGCLRGEWREAWRRLGEVW